MKKQVSRTFFKPKTENTKKGHLKSFIQIKNEKPKPSKWGNLIRVRIVVLSLKKVNPWHPFSSSYAIHEDL